MKNSICKTICSIICLFSWNKGFCSDKEPVIILENNYERTIRQIAPFVKTHLERRFDDPEMVQNPEKYLQEHSHSTNDIINIGTNVFRDYFNSQNDIEDKFKHRVQKLYKDFIDDEERDQIAELHISKKAKEAKFQKSLEAEVQPFFKTKFRNRLYRGEFRYLLENTMFNAEIDARFFTSEKLRARLNTKKFVFKEMGLDIYGNIQYRGRNGGSLESELIISSISEWFIILGNYKEIKEGITDNRLTFQYNTRF